MAFSTDLSVIIPALHEGPNPALLLPPMRESSRFWFEGSLDYFAAQVVFLAPLHFQLNSLALRPQPEHVLTGRWLRGEISGKMQRIRLSEQGMFQAGKESLSRDWH